MGGSAQRMGGSVQRMAESGQRRGGLAGPCTSWGGSYKASGVAGEPWRTWLGWRRRLEAGAVWGGRGGAGAGEGSGRATCEYGGEGTCRNHVKIGIV